MFFENPLYGVPEMFSEPNLKKDLMKKHPDCSLILQEYSPANSFISIEKPFVVPRFINTARDISPPLKEILKRSDSGFGRIARWVRAQNLSYECVNTTDAQQEFYYQMFLPFIGARHKDSALIVSYENVFSPNVRFDLILVSKNGERLAGAVLHYWENRPTLGFFGVKMDKIQELSKWNTGAMYYFAMLEAKKKGIKVLHLGGSSAFLKNGINAQKARLGAKTDEGVPWQDSGIVKLTVLKKTEALCNFFAANPFAFIGNDGKCKAAIWLPHHKNAGLAETEKQIAFASRIGIETLDLFSWRKNPSVNEILTKFPDIDISIKKFKN